MTKDMESFKSINMLSSAYKIKGQGVGSAYEEQVELVKKCLTPNYEISENEIKIANITHYHTIDFFYYLFMPFVKRKSITVGYVHMLPETVENSVNLPPLFKKVFYRYMIDFYKKMDFLVTVNSYFIAKLADLGIDKNKVVYIPNYVSDQTFCKFPLAQKEKIKQKYQIPEAKFVVLGVGQLQIRKGVFDFIEVAKRMPDMEFVWAGGFSFGAISDGYQEIKDIMRNPPANVTFLGIIEREKMPEIYNLADIMFLPSFEELFPMTVLESMSCHIPMVLRDLEIYPEILFDFYLKENSVDGFIAILQKLREDTMFYQLACDNSKRGSLFYSASHVGTMWQAFYDRVSKSPPKNKKEKNNR